MAPWTAGTPLGSWAASLAVGPARGVGYGVTRLTSASLGTWKNQELRIGATSSSWCGLGSRLKGPAVAHTSSGV